MGRALLFLVLIGVMLAGCGAGVNWFPTIGPDSPASITVTASSTSPVVGASVTITATVKKADGTAVADGTQISFTTVGGTLSGFSAATTGGVASVVLTNTSATSCTVTASTGIVSGHVTVTYVSAITLTPSTSSVAIGNLITITASVKKTDGTAVNDGTTVTFTSNGGNLSASTATTSGGIATVTIGSGVQGTFTVTAAVGTDSNSIVVSFF